MRLGAFELNEPLPELNEPHALAMLRPWIDVGSVGSLTLSWLETHLKARELARIARPGNFFDFTRYRPVVYFSEGSRQVAVPNVRVTCGRQETGNDFLFLHLLSLMPLERCMLIRCFGSSPDSVSKGFTSWAACMISFLIRDPC